ncbi:hypothetical protein BH20CHL6_BH20CHL6_13160 [soil metagenome]
MLTHAIDIHVAARQASLYATAEQHQLGRLAAPAAAPARRPSRGSPVRAARTRLGHALVAIGTYLAGSPTGQRAGTKSARPPA